jgi:hypothetical protein
LDRERELAELARILRRPRAQFLAMYGRRRIGKTALLLKWLEGGRHPAAYFVAQRTTSRLLLGKFSQALSPLLGTESDLSFESWDDALVEIANRARDQRVILVIDELPYLLESEPGFASALQAAWDQRLSSTKLVLAVAGSRYHMMEETFTSGKGPLFGRTTADLLLGEIEPKRLSLFLPRYSPNQLVEVLSVVGGVPKYLEMWNDRWPVLRNIEETILSPVSIFRGEPILLIQDEIAEPRTYLAILEALGVGASGPTRISKQTGIALPHVSKYLRTLRDLGLVKRIVSLEAIGKRDTRQTRYEIADPYLRFHFAFVRPHQHLLEQHRVGRLMEIIRERFDSHVGRHGYEELCRRHVAALADGHELPFEVTEVGRLWDRQVEIDVAALDRRSRSLLLGECRWTSRKMSVADLDRLQHKAQRLRKARDYRKNLALFSRAGFTKGLAKRAAQEDVLLFAGPLLDPEP